MQLREYQEECVATCIEELLHGGNALISAPTGSGKSWILAYVIKRLMKIVPTLRVCVLIDRETLVRQLAETMEQICEVPVGIACASVDKKVVTAKKITIASRQTLSNNMLTMEGVGVLICDEAHLVPLRPSKTQYVKLIDKLKEYNPNMRLLGCTASPYRLDSGFIYGNRHRGDLKPHWDDLTYKIDFETLQKDGHLCKLRGLIANYDKPDLSGVKITAGEYNLRELSDTMCKYVDTVNDVINEHLQIHKHILVFATTIEHCEEIKAVVPNSETLHSKSKKPLEKLEAFKNGEFRVLISVNKLSIGFDFPAASALVLARPTMSPALFLQIVGRVLRPFEGKDHAVLVDLTNNVAMHCPSLDLDKIKVKIPFPPGGGTPPVKFCEAELGDGTLCYTECHPAVMECPTCGAKFPARTIPQEFMPALKALNFEPEPPEWLEVNAMSVEEHISKKKEKRLLRVKLVHYGSFKDNTASMWICCASDYSKGAVKRGKEVWSQFTDEEFPEDTDTALWIAQQSFKTPKRMLITKTVEGWLNIVTVDFDSGV